LKKKKAGGAKKKKEDKSEAPAEAEASTEATTTEDKPEEAAPEPDEATSASPAPAEDDDEPSELAVSKPSHGHKPSVAIESRQRSESFFRSGAAGGPLSPGGGVTGEVYREQHQKIEELEKDNKRLASEIEENQTRWKKGEEELEELREGRGDVALAVEKGKEADKLVREHGRRGTGSMLTCGPERRSRVTKETALAGSNPKQEIHKPHVDRITQPERVYR
jgi:hypothetical protein